MQLVKNHYLNKYVDGLAILATELIHRIYVPKNFENK